VSQKKQNETPSAKLFKLYQLDKIIARGLAIESGG
jgi:hypothetical protein